MPRIPNITPEILERYFNPDYGSSMSGASSSREIESMPGEHTTFPLTPEEGPFAYTPLLDNGERRSLIDSSDRTSSFSGEDTSVSSIWPRLVTVNPFRWLKRSRTIACVRCGRMVSAHYAKRVLVNTGNVKVVAARCPRPGETGYDLVGKNCRPDGEVQKRYPIQEQ